MSSGEKMLHKNTKIKQVKGLSFVPLPMERIGSNEMKKVITGELNER